ncbi:MAG TPA: hypothetical protein PLV32_11880, partial [Chitinophagaceae bacterium]|nr:hypothetical protein [Chitinophagaceae bacterium]
MKLYRKFFHRDSLRLVREMEKYWEEQQDSQQRKLTRAEAQVIKAEKNLARKLRGDGDAEISDEMQTVADGQVFQETSDNGLLKAAEDIQV